MDKVYDQIFALGVVFTNFHLDMHPLRKEDSNWFNRFRNRMQSISEEKKAHALKTYLFAVSRRKFIPLVFCITIQLEISKQRFRSTPIRSNRMVLLKY